MTSWMLPAYPADDPSPDEGAQVSEGRLRHPVSKVVGAAPKTRVHPVQQDGPCLIQRPLTKLAHFCPDGGQGGFSRGGGHGVPCRASPLLPPDAEAQEVEALIDMSNPRFRLRQDQAHRAKYRCRLVAQAFGVFAGSCDQQHVIIRVANEAVVGEALEPSLLASPWSHRCPGPGEMLIQNRESNVAEQRREYPPLRGAGVRVPLHAILTEDACFDISLDNPLVRAGAEVVNLGNGVVSPASWTEAVAARLEVRLEDRLEHQLECGLHHPVPHRGDPQHPAFPAGLGDHSLTHGPWLKRPGFQLGPEIGEELLLTQSGGDVVGRLAIDARRARPSIAPHPLPSHDQEGGVRDEVVEVVEPTIGIVGSPLVQLGLDLQYPRFGLGGCRPRSVGIHRRSPDIPIPNLRTRCPPSPCNRLSRSRTTTRTPPRHEAIWRTTLLPTTDLAGRPEGNPIMVPAFAVCRLTDEVPHFSPAASP